MTDTPEKEDWHMSDDCHEEGDEQDFTSPSYVLGAVLAQLEDLPREEQCQVLHLALAAIETVQETENEILATLTEDEKCPKCGSDMIEFVDDDYCECVDCGWSGSPNPDNQEGQG